jgi:hypothetical protein
MGVYVTKRAPGRRALCYSPISLSSIFHVLNASKLNPPDCMFRSWMSVWVCYCLYGLETLSLTLREHDVPSKTVY